MSYRAPLILFASHSILFVADHLLNKRDETHTFARITEPLTIIFVLFLLSWFRASIIKPIPSTKFPKHNDPIVQQYLARKKSNSQMPRFCKTCKIYKPDRAHHCYILNSCVLIMDHYSPYILNSVGHHNIKMFLLFRFYSILHTLGICITFVQTLLSSNSNYLNTLTVVSVIIFSFAVCSFHVYIFWMSSVWNFSGYTTIEACENHLSRDPSFHGLWKDGSLYDHGFLRNVQYLLGKWPWLWLLPIGSANNGNGFLPVPNEKGKALLLQACKPNKEPNGSLSVQATCKQIAIEKLKSKKE